MVSAGLGLLALLALSACAWGQQMNAVTDIERPPTSCETEHDCDNKGRCIHNWPEETEKEELARMLLPDFEPSEYWPVCECTRLKNGRMPKGPRCEEALNLDIRTCNSDNDCGGAKEGGRCLFREDGFGYCVCLRTRTGDRCQDSVSSERIGQQVLGPYYPGGGIYGGSNYWGYPNTLPFVGQPFFPFRPTTTFRYFPVTYPYTYYPTNPFIQPIQPFLPTLPIQPIQPTQPIGPIQPTNPVFPVQPTATISTTGCTNSGECFNGGQCLPSPNQAGVQMQGQCQCQGNLQGPQCQGMIVTNAVCTTGNIIGVVNCGQGGQCLQRGPLEAYCVCPAGTTGVDCSGTTVPLGSATAFPSVLGRPPFVSQGVSFNTQPFQRYSRFFNANNAGVPGRRLMARTSRNQPSLYRSASALAKDEGRPRKDDDLP